MADRRTERMAGYIRHEHANSFAVDTGGLKELVFGNKPSQSRQELTEAVSHLQKRVTLLESSSDRNAVRTSHIEESQARAHESASRTIYALHKEVEHLEEQVRQQTKQYNKWYIEMHAQLLKIEEFVKEQQAMNKHSAGAIDAIQKVVLRIPGLRVQN